MFRLQVSVFVCFREHLGRRLVSILPGFVSDVHEKDAWSGSGPVCGVRIDGHVIYCCWVPSGAGEGR